MIITKTPLRISLLGGNTDFRAYFEKYGGAVLTTTIDKYVYCIVKERFDDEIWINYSIKEKVKDVSQIKHDLVREAMKLTEVISGVEITFLSDIPSEGSGLGSSSAVLVGLLNALHTYKGENASAGQLAAEACFIEVDQLKKPIGYQDQYAVAYGGSNLIEFGKSIRVKPIEITKSYEWMLFYTGITRKAETILSNMKLNKRILDKNKALVYESRKKEMGEYFDIYWQLKKKLNPSVTNITIDAMYQGALDAGARGGKIVGAGGGGFLLLEVPIENKENVRARLRLKELPFRLSRFGSQVIFNISE